jgi:hypothetical protein
MFEMLGRYISIISHFFLPSKIYDDQGSVELKSKQSQSTYSNFIRKVRLSLTISFLMSSIAAFLPIEDKDFVNVIMTVITCFIFIVCLELFRTIRVSFQ